LKHRKTNSDKAAPQSSRKTQGAHPAKEAMERMSPILMMAAFYIDNGGIYSSPAIPIATRKLRHKVTQ
jgi:hypothetical protein